MINPKSFEAANAYIISQIKHSEEIFHSNPKKIANPFITISREAGAGGTIVGEMLVKNLNEKYLQSATRWALFDKNLIELVVEEHHLPDEFKNYLPESKISELQNVFEQICGLHPSFTKLTKKTCSTILHLAAIGHVVIIGRGANILTKNLPGGLHIRLIADIDFKIKNIENYYNLSRKKAINFIEKEDIGRKEYVKKLFSKNVDDNLLYDLIINTSKVSFNKTVELISNYIIKE